MKRKWLYAMCAVVGIMIGVAGCGTPKDDVPTDTKTTQTVTKDPETTLPTPTEVLRVTETLCATAAPEPTKAPDPTATPEPTKAPDPTATPEPTKAPDPTATPEPTKAPDPTATPEPTKAPDPTATPEPTKAPDPTATPKPTPKPEPTPAPTPKPGAEVTIRFFAPKILQDLNSIVASDAMDFLNQMSEYSMPSKGMMTETAILSDETGEYFALAEAGVVQKGEVLENAKARYGEDVIVTANGWYDSDKSHLVEVQKDVWEPRINYYSSRSEKSFAEFGIVKGDEIQAFANYWVEMNGKLTLYNPCILTVQLDLGIFKTTMTYLVAMPIKERITLPKLDGYEMRWVEDNNTLSPEKIRIIDGMINRYTLVVKPK